MNAEQYEKIAHATGFVAALDQSGGSTPEPCPTTASNRTPGPAMMRCSISSTRCGPG